MNTFARRDKIMDEFRRESRGSFSVVYKALADLSNEKRTATLNAEDVKNRIREILNEKKHETAE